MMIDIMGFKSLNTDKKVEVMFKTGLKSVYDPEKTHHLILNKDDVVEIRTLKEDKK